MSEINKIKVGDITYNIEDSVARDIDINWGVENNLNDYTTEGVYNVKGNRVTGDNMPINNEGNIAARLSVLVTENENGNSEVITQVLNLNNNQGGEGNVYIRSQQNGTWKPWAKLQTNIDVGIINSSQLNNLTDSGIYSGIIEGTGETFIIICINNYTVAQEIHNIAQLKYSLVLTHEVKIEKRIRNVDYSWSDWENIESGATLPEATQDVIGGVKLGKSINGGWIALGNIINNNGSGLGLRIDSSVFKNTVEGRDGLGLIVGDGSGLKIENGLKINLGTVINTPIHNAIPLCIGTPANLEALNQITGNKKADAIPIIPVNPDQFKLGQYGLELINTSSTNKVIWDANSNMNNFKTPGVYEIYGERTVKTDNLPITNDGSGHSIAARLTVVASTLQPANNEICVTQFLQLSNRVGGEGTIYVRTYNENNNGMNGWSAWQKQMGMVETLINSDDATVGQEIFSTVAQKIGDGLNGMIDNGMYSGIYIDNLSYTGTGSLYALSAQPTFVETFALIVINDYAASGKLGMQRHITQLKYAVDAITGQSTVKKRVGTGNDTISWSDWEDIYGGGVQEVDVTDAVKSAGLLYLVTQGLAKEGVTYVINFFNSDLNSKIISLDSGGKLADFFKDKYAMSPGGGCIKFNYKVLKGHPNYNNDAQSIDGVLYSDLGKYNFYIIYDTNTERIIKVSQDMTLL